MSCCGQSRTAPLTPRHRMKVRYSGGRPIKVWGPVTGATYSFSGQARTQLLDPRDAVIVARGGKFSIEGIVELPPGLEIGGRERKEHG